MCLYFPLSLSFHSVLYTFLVYIICLPRILSLLYPSFFLPFPFLHIPRLPIFKHPRTEGQETRCFPPARFRSFSLSLSFCSLHITGLHNMSTPPLPSLSLYLPFCLSIPPFFPSLLSIFPVCLSSSTHGQKDRDPMPSAARFRSAAASSITYVCVIVQHRAILPRTQTRSLVGKSYCIRMYRVVSLVCIKL